MSHEVKKSMYIFLTSLMGMLLFILLQRSLFLLAFLAGANVLTQEFQALDYFTFVAAIFVGWWYGIWLGLHWYRSVYEEGTANGFFQTLRAMFSGGSQVHDRFQLFAPSHQWELDDLMQPAAEPENSAAVSRGLKPSFEVFEANTVVLTGGDPVHASRLHEQPVVARKVSRTRKPAARKLATKKQ